MFRLALSAIAIGMSLVGVSHAGTLAEIKARGTFRVGVEAKNPPGVFRQGNTIVGYDVDIAKYVADKIGVKIEYVDTEWSGILPALIADKFDAIFSSMTISKARLEKVNFSIPYNFGAMGLLVDGNSSIKTARDMSGKRLGIAIGSFYVKPIEEFNKKLRAEGLAPIETPTYDSLVDVLTDLQNKRIDAAIERPVTFRLWQKNTNQAKDRFRFIQDLTEIMTTVNAHGAAVAKGNDELLAFINTTITELHANGKLTELQNKWLDGAFDVPLAIPRDIP